MIRIIGCYSHNTGTRQHGVPEKIGNAFKRKIPYLQLSNFDFGPISLSYETIRSEAARDFFFIDKKQDRACFIVGNIFAFEKNGRQEILRGLNKAEYVLALRKKYGLGFAKYLRGEFNIVLAEARTLFLINDCLGLSPMYLYNRQEGTLFCNTAEPLIWAQKNHRLDFGSIAGFLRYGFVPQRRTFIQNLVNQEPGSIIRLDQRGLTKDTYSAAKKPSAAKGTNLREKTEILKDIFREAVAIRCPDAKCHASLSGGWDTRLILANLLKLEKSVTVFTSTTRKDNTDIASRIARSFGLRHILHTSAPVSEKTKRDQAFKFRAIKSIPDVYRLARGMWEKNRFMTTPRFEGFYGTELFGVLPDEFTKKILLLKGPARPKRFFTEAFAKKSSDLPAKGVLKKKLLKNGLLRFFLTEVGGSYLNTFYTGSGWERPTWLFSYLFLVPFADSKFVEELGNMKYPDDFYYRTYQALYKKYFLGFLRFPWTFARYRLRHDLKKKGQRTNTAPLTEEKRYYLTLMKTDMEFRKFLAANKIILKNHENIVSRLKELYFFFEWLRNFKDRICDKDIQKIIET